MANVLFPFPSVDFSASSSEREAQFDAARWWADAGEFPGYDIFIDACDIIEVRLNAGCGADELKALFDAMLFAVTTYHAGVVDGPGLDDDLYGLACNLVC